VLRNSSPSANPKHHFGCEMRLTNSENDPP